MAEPQGGQDGSWASHYFLKCMYSVVSYGDLFVSVVPFPWKGSIIDWWVFFPIICCVKSKYPCIGVSHCSILWKRRLACWVYEQKGNVLFPSRFAFVYDSELLKTLYWHAHLPVREGNSVHEDWSKGWKQGDPVWAVLLLLIVTFLLLWFWET